MQLHNSLTLKPHLSGRNRDVCYDQPVTDAVTAPPGPKFPLCGNMRNACPSLAGVAQLVEQLIRNQQVSGSSPLAGSNLTLINQSASGSVLIAALSAPSVCSNSAQNQHPD